MDRFPAQCSRPGVDSMTLAVNWLTPQAYRGRHVWPGTDCPSTRKTARRLAQSAGGDHPAYLARTLLNHHHGATGSALAPPPHA